MPNLKINKFLFRFVDAHEIQREILLGRPEEPDGENEIGHAHQDT